MVSGIIRFVFAAAAIVAAIAYSQASDSAFAQGISWGLGYMETSAEWIVEQINKW